MPVAAATDVHRLYLQALLSRRYLSDKLSRQLYQRAQEIINSVDGDVPGSSYEDFIAEIGEHLSPLGLEIRQMVDQVTQEKMTAIVNTKGDAIAQAATDFTPLEIAYFKLIVECIMLAPSESFSLSSLAALKECSNLNSKMTKTEADNTLRAFVAKGWLVKSQRGRYSLSTRSILELQTYLKTTFEDEVLECTICMEICTQGIACPTDACKTRMHTHCYTSHKRRFKMCPSCNTSWENGAVLPVGEEAVKDGDDHRRRPRRQDSDDEEEAQFEQGDDDGDEDMDKQPAPRQKSTRVKKGILKHAVASEMEDEEPSQQDEEPSQQDEEEDEDMEQELTQPVKKERRRSRR